MILNKLYKSICLKRHELNERTDKNSCCLSELYVIVHVERATQIETVYAGVYPAIQETGPKEQGPISLPLPHDVHELM